MAPEPATETQPVSLTTKGAIRRREMSSREIGSPAIGKIEPLQSRDKVRVGAERERTQIAELDEKNWPMLSSEDEAQEAREIPIARTRWIDDETEARRPNWLARDVSQELPPAMRTATRSARSSSRIVPTGVTDEPAPTLEPRRADAARIEDRVPGMSDEPAPILEPRRADVAAHATPIPDEPRLVIGQLRVDVVAAAASQAREVVRVVTRTVDSGRSSNTGGPLSKLRFGLGQM
jgi:hypothetical protein